MQILAMRFTKVADFSWYERDGFLERGIPKQYICSRGNDMT